MSAQQWLWNLIQVTAWNTLTQFHWYFYLFRFLKHDRQSGHVFTLSRFYIEEPSSFSLSKTFVQHRYFWLFLFIESRGIGLIDHTIRCVYDHIRVDGSHSCPGAATYCGRVVLSTRRNTQWDFSDDVAMSLTLNFVPGRMSAVDKWPGNALIAIEVAREQGRDHENSLVTGLSPTLDNAMQFASSEVYPETQIWHAD